MRVRVRALIYPYLQRYFVIAAACVKPTLTQKHRIFVSLRNELKTEIKKKNKQNTRARAQALTTQRIKNRNFKKKEVKLLNNSLKYQ